MSRQHLAPWLLFLAVVIIYLAFPARVYYWDGISFAQAIEDASSLSPSLVHPNHLIYNFAGYIFYKLLLSAGFELRAVTALQILNSILSATCAAVLFVILIETVRSLYLSICVTLLFAFSATWWKFSTDANAYIPSVLFVLVSFYLVLPNRKARPLLTALTFSISMAFHQLAVLTLPVLALGVYLQDGPLSLRRRALNATYFAVAALTLIAGAYGFLFYLASGAFDIWELIHWSASYSPDADTGFNLWSNLQYSLRGHVRLFFGGRFNLLKGLVNPLVILLLAALATAVLLLLYDALRNAGRLAKLQWLRELRLESHQQTVLLLSLLWAIVYVVFLFFWLPQNTFYRLFYLPALMLLLGLGLSSLRRPGRFVAVLVSAVVLANFLFLIYPFSHAEKYPPLAFALRLDREWRAGTVVYYGTKNTDEELIRYFTPGTHWRPLAAVDSLDQELAGIHISGGTAWFETTAIDQFASTPEGARWLEIHARKDSWREVNDKAYKIRFVQVVPQSQ